MRSIPILVQPGTGYDLLLTGPLITDPSTERRIAAAADIRRRARAVDDGALARDFARIGRDPFISLLGFAHGRTERPTAENVVAAIRESDARDFVLSLVGYYRRAYRAATSPEVIRAAVDGDRDAIREFQRTSYSGVAHWQASLRHILGRDVEEVRDEVAALLGRWLETGFGDMAPALEAAQRTDAQRVQELVATRDLDDVLSQIVPSITFAREIGQSLVVLAPSGVIRPGWAMADFGPNLVIAYPAEHRLEPGETPPRLVAMAKALGDDLRVRVLRELRTGPISASELARRLGVPRTSLQHHLGILINAGLVRLATDDARWGQLELRREGITELTSLASDWILDEGPAIPDVTEAGSI